MKAYLWVAALLVALGGVCHTREPQPTPTLKVYPEHEANYRQLSSWLASDPVLSGKSALREALQRAFQAAQMNAYSDYLRWATAFEREFQRLSQEEQQRIVEFALTHFERVERQMSSCENCCTATCGLTSCEIQCPDGTKPKCQCHIFFADCGCEPYR